MTSEPYRVDIKLKHPKATVSQVHLAPGQSTPEHTHAHGYVVHPRAATRLRKVTKKGDQVISTEEIEHKPDEPYFVGASEDGTSFTLTNIGNGPMLCEKTFIYK